MKKTLFLLTLLSSSLFSFDAYIQTSSSLCLHDLAYSNNKITSVYEFEGNQYVLEKSISWYTQNTTEAYYYDGICNDNPLDGFPNTDWLELNMTQDDYNFNMALTANLLGFTLVFLVGFLFILQGRR